MDSRLRGVPPSTTQMGPNAAPSCNTASGIRAPLTVDESDFDCSVSPKSPRNGTTSSYPSGSELESEGFASGEDDFETAATERHFATDQDEGFLEETHFVKEYAFSKPSLIKPNGEIGQRSSNSNALTFSRAYVKKPYEANAQESVNFTRKAFLVPFAGKPDEKISKGVRIVNDSDASTSRSFLSESGDEHDVLDNGDSLPLVGVTDEEVWGNEPIPVVGMESPLVQKLQIPIAQISLDSDNESESSLVSEDDGFSGVARIPSIEVLPRLNSAPIARISEVDEGDEHDSRPESMEFIEELGTSDSLLESKDEKGHFDVDPVNCVISADLVQDKAPDPNKEAKANSLIVDKVCNCKFEQEQEEDLLLLNEEIREIDVIADQRKCVDLIDQGKPTDLGCTSFVAPAAELGCLCGTVKLMEPEGTELGSCSNFGAASVDDGNLKRCNTSLEDNLVFDQDIAIDKLETESEQENDKPVESISFITAHKNESVYRCDDIKEMSHDHCHQLSEIPEAVTGGLQVDTSDDLGNDVSLTGLTKACQSVLEGKLDQEAEKAAEQSVLLSGVVEHLAFHIETKEMEAEIEQEHPTSLSGGESLLDQMKEIDGRIITDSDETLDVDCRINDGKLMIDSAAVAASFKTDKGAVSDDRTVKLVSVDSIERFSVESNSGDLNSMILSTRPIIDARSPNLSDPSLSNCELEEALSGTENKLLEKIQQIQAKYLWLLRRLRCSPEDSVASKVLYQLKTAEARISSQHAHLDSTKKAAMKLEPLKRDDLDFSVCILVIGKTGVGKSSTINSIFGEKKTTIDAFEPATSHVKEIIGMIDGVKLKVLDTPGLSIPLIDQTINRKVLASIKRVMRRSPPDLILYVDRLDTQASELNDFPLLKSVTSCLGSSLWQKSILALTHATSVPPDGPTGHPSCYEAFVAQQSRVFQQLVSHSAGDPLLMNPCSKIPVCLVENHPTAIKNGYSETLLPSGESWRSWLLLLCYSIKTLSEVSSVGMTQSTLNLRKLFGLPIHSPSLSYLCSLFQSDVHPKLSNDHNGETVNLDVERVHSSNSDQGEDIEYENLAPHKKLLREKMRRFGDFRKVGIGAGDEIYLEAVVGEGTGSLQAVPVPLPDMELPPSFDGGNPSLRHRILEPSSQLLAWANFHSNGWDHDFGYDGVVIEDKFKVESRFPAVISVQLDKDKNELNIMSHSSTSAKHKDKGSTMARQDARTFRKKLAYVLKRKSRIRNFLGEHAMSGLEVENQIAVGKRLMLVGNAGVVISQDDEAYGANLELWRRDKDYPIGPDQMSLGLSVMRYRGDLTCGCNLQSRFSVGRNTKLNIRAGLDNKLKGQISIKTSSSDPLQIAALAFLPIAKAIFKKVFPQSTKDYSA